MAVTLKDIAAQLGLSVTTVSRALAGYSDVSRETQVRVRGTAAALGYVPNVTARQLQKRRTDTLGFVIPTFGPRFADPFFSEFLAGVGNEAALRGFDLLVSTRAPGGQEEEAYLRMTQSRRVDGFILVRTRRQDWRIRYLSESGVPFVAFGRCETDVDYPYVDMDGRAGIRAVVDHLVEQGHRHIGFVVAPHDLFFAHERLLGYEEGLAAHSLPFDPQLVVEGDLTEGSGRDAARHLLARTARPTAIIACNDLMAFGAISAAQELGLEVGQDVAITGFDGVPASEHTHPPLTTVYQPVYEIGHRVTRMLVDQINGCLPAEHQVLLQPTLTIRGSSAGRARVHLSPEADPSHASGRGPTYGGMLVAKGTNRHGQGPGRRRPIPARLRGVPGRNARP